jgi:hypothetical protein
MACYIQYIATLVLLSMFAQKVSAVCVDKYRADFAFAEALAPLKCSPFEGSPTLHAVVYGCRLPNQDEAANGLVSQSFTQMCTAQPTSDTNFTCYGEF